MTIRGNGAYALLMCALAAACAACSGDDESLPDEGIPGDCPPAFAWDGAACQPSARFFDRRGCEGKYGPVAENDAAAIFVDASAAAGGIGSAGAPFTSIQAAVDAAPAGGTVAIARGTYPGDVSVGKPLTVEARCARDVIVDGSIAIASGDVAVRGLQVTNGQPGISVADAASGAGVELRWLYVTANRGAGVRAERSALALSESEIAATTEIPASIMLGEDGVGLYMADGVDFEGTTVSINMNRTAGIEVADATGTTAAAVPTAGSTVSINMNLVQDNGSDGIRFRTAGYLELAPAAEAAQVIAASTISGNAGHGVLAKSVNLRVEGTRLDNNGFGINMNKLARTRHPRGGFFEVFPAQLTALDVRLVASGNDLGESASFGIQSQSGSAEITDNDVAKQAESGILVIGTESASINMNRVVESGYGGIVVRSVATTTLVKDNTVTNNTHGGVVVSYSEGVQIADNVISGTLIDPSLDIYSSGTGLWIEESPGASLSGNNIMGGAGAGLGVRCWTAAPTFTVSANLISDVRLAGIDIAGCAAGGSVAGNMISGVAGNGLRILSVTTTQITVSNNTITGTTVRTAGSDGDGIMMDNSAATFDGNTVNDSARIGILATGATCNGAMTGNTVGAAQTDIVFQNAGSMFDGGNTADPATSVAAGTYAVDQTDLTTFPIGS